MASATAPSSGASRSVGLASCYTLEQLIGEVTDANRHGELGWGPPIDGEAW